MNSDEVLKQLAPWREANWRPAWVPVVEERDGPAGASKFSGRPWLAEGEGGPCGTGCKSPMQLVLQLDLSKLPEDLNRQFGEGLLQLFYCAGECDAELCGWEAFSEGKLVRVVQRGGRETPVDPPKGHFPAKVIIGWERVDDYPGVV